MVWFLYKGSTHGDELSANQGTDGPHFKNNFTMWFFPILNLKLVQLDKALLSKKKSKKFLYS